MGMKFGLLLGAGVGYVLGTKAGRGRYEQLRGLWKGVSENPRVAQPAQNAKERVQDAVRAQGEKVTDAVADAVKERLFGGGTQRPRASEYVDVEVEFPAETENPASSAGMVDDDGERPAAGGSWSAYR